MITLADGSMISTSGKGTVGSFNDVNYVPEFKYNLLSVHQLTQQGYDVTFTREGGVIIQSRESGHGQMIGQFTNGMYMTVKPTEVSLIDHTPVVVRDQSNRYMVPPAMASDLMHQRWGHSFIKRLMDAQAKGLVQGFSTSIKPIHFCDACAKAKLHMTPASRSPGHQPNQPIIIKRLHKVICDISGRIHIPGIRNVNYFMLFIDQATRYQWIYFLGDVGTESVLAHFQKFHLKVIQAQEVLGEIMVMKTFKADHAGCFKDAIFVDYLNSKGIKVEFSAPNSHYQNVVAERAIRTMREMGMSMMLDAKMPKYLRPYAFRHAV